jgi:predicted acetyltransferase
MGESDLRLEGVTSSETELLANLLELYSHDLSEVFPIDTGSDGRFGYPPLALYWTEPERRFPFFIKRSHRILGFVLITLDDARVHDIAEFFVLRRYRRSGVGREAAFLAWDRHPGSWTVRVAEGNAGALEFWRSTIDQYTHGAVSELTRPGNPIAWRVFAFHSRKHA